MALGEGHLAGETHRGAAAGEQASLGLHDREAGVGRGDAHVGAAQQLHAARGAEAVDGGDDRLVDLDLGRPEHGVGAVGDPAPVDFLDVARGDLLLQLGDLGDVGLEVGAHAERLAHAGDDGHPGFVVVLEAPPGLGQIPEVVHIQRVAGRPVDRDHDYVLVAHLVVDGHP